MEGKEIFGTDFCSIFWHEDLSMVREEWKLANCPITEFKKMLMFIKEFCRDNQIRNLVIDAFGAISLLPETHHEWLDEEFNKMFVTETVVDHIFLIVPESLVTSISVSRYYDSIRKNNHDIRVYKMKKLEEVLNLLYAGQKK